MKEKNSSKKSMWFSNDVYYVLTTIVGVILLGLVIALAANCS